MERRKEKFYKKELVMLDGCKGCQNKNCKWNGKVATSGVTHRGIEKFGCNISKKVN